MKKIMGILLITLFLLGGSTCTQAQIYLHGGVTGVLEDTIYFIDGGIIAYDLVIEAGARFYFLQDSWFDISGFFQAVGTEQDSIKFLLAPGVSGWEGFYHSSADSSRMEYCYITGATGTSGISFSGDYSFSHCVFEGNTGNGGIHGFSGKISITDCKIIGNYSESECGGITVSDADVQIKNCIITDNWTDGNGGGIGISDSRVEVINCLIAGNSAEMGAGVYCVGYDSICAVRFVDCTIANNNDALYGGGFYFDQSNPTIENCTIIGNSTLSHGVAVFCQWSTPTILNTIVFGNTGGSAILLQDSTTASITYCDFYNNLGGNFSGEVSDSLEVIVTTNSNGDSCDIFQNIYFDPLLIAPDHGDYHLLAGSPCIDAGNPQSPLDPDSTFADIGAFYFDQSSSVEPERPTAPPVSFVLLSNYPNPFNISTTLTYDVPHAGWVTLAIYNILGQRIEILSDGFQAPGRYSVRWEASDMSSGIYIAQIKTVSQVANIKMILLK